MVLEKRNLGYGCKYYLSEFAKRCANGAIIIVEIHKCVSPKKGKVAPF